MLAPIPLKRAYRSVAGIRSGDKTAGQEAFLNGWFCGRLKGVQLDTHAGNLVLKANGKDGVVVLTTKDGKLIRYEEKGGKIHVSELPSQDNTPGVNAIRNN
jgi:hypothetical protein